MNDYIIIVAPMPSIADDEKLRELLPAAKRYIVDASEISKVVDAVHSQYGNLTKIT